MDDVASYLSLIGLGEYANKFRENAITGRDLMVIRIEFNPVLPNKQDLNSDDLISLGMSRIGHRKQFLRRISALQGTLTTLEEEEEDSPGGSDEAEFGTFL